MHERTYLQRLQIGLDVDASQHVLVVAVEKRLRVQVQNFRVCGERARDAQNAEQGN